MKTDNKKTVIGGVLLAVSIVGILYTGNKYHGILEPKPIATSIEYKAIYNINRESLERFISQSNPKIYGRMRKEIIDYATDSSKKYYLSSQLVIAMMKPESEFNTFAVSKANCIGIMQVNWKMWKDALKKAKIAVRIDDLYDPKINIEAGCYILRQHINQTKDIKQALYKYLGDDHLPYYDAIKDGLGTISMINIEMEVIK